MRFLFLVPTGSELACKTYSTLRMFTLFRFYFSLALESILKKAPSSQHTWFEISEQQASPTSYFALIMERLFSRCTRLRDILLLVIENQQENLANDSSDDSSLDDSSTDVSPPDDSSADDDSESFRKLNLDVSIDEFLSTESGFTYADL